MDQSTPLPPDATPLSPARRLWAWLTRSSIRRKILTVIFISGLVPAVTVLLLARLGVRHAIDAGVAHFMLDRASAVANDIDHALATLLADAQGDAADGRLAAALTAGASPEHLAAVLDGTGFPFLIDTEARLLAGDLGLMHLDRTLREHAAERDLLAVVQPIVLEHFAPGSRAAHLVLLAPVLDGHGHTLALAGRVIPVEDLAVPLLPDPIPDLSITLLSGQGLAIGGAALTAAQQRALDELLVEHPGAVEGWGRFATEDAPHLVLAFRQLRLLAALASERRAVGPWTVCLGYTLGPLLGPLEFDLWRIGLAGFVAVAACLGIGLALARRFINPLRLLRAEVEQISDGRLDQRLDVRTNDEIEVLAENINLMAARLAATHDDLESKIGMLREQTAQLETLRAITRSITEALELPELLATFEREVRRLAEFDALWLARVAPGRWLEVIHASWMEGKPPAGFEVGRRWRIPGSRLGRAVAEEAPDVVADLAASTEGLADDAAMVQGGLVSALILPLTSPGGVIGVAALGSRRAAAFGANQVRLVAQAAEQLAIGIEHARLYEELRTLALELEDKVAARTAELEAAQRRLFQAEKFAAMGQLSANIAHEINNPLGIIKNYVRLLGDNLRGSGGGRRRTDPNIENLGVIEEEIDRIARIVKNLLSLYRPPPGRAESHAVAINDEIEAIVRLVETGLEKRGIRLRLDLAPDLPRLRCSPDLIRQVFLNLIRNAEDAMEGREKGELRIATALEVKKAGAQIVATVADSGHGIAPEHLGMIFDPFFTTKEESGTGLGLSVTYSIVESLGGVIEVESRAGEGALFRLNLPVSPESGGAEGTP